MVRHHNGGPHGASRRVVPPDRPSHGRGSGARAADGGGGGPGGRGHRGGGPRERSLDGVVPVVPGIAGGIGELRDHPGRRHSGNGVRGAGAPPGAARVLAAHRGFRAAAGDGRAGAAVRRGPDRGHDAGYGGRHAAARRLRSDRGIPGLGDRIAGGVSRRRAGADRRRPSAGAGGARRPRPLAHRGGPLRRDGHRARPAAARPNGATGPDLRLYAGRGAGLARRARPALAARGLHPAGRHRHRGRPPDAQRVPLESPHDELRHDPGGRLPHLQHHQRLHRPPAPADRHRAGGGGVAGDGAGGVPVRGGRLRRPRGRGRPRAGAAARDRRGRYGRADRQLALREQHAGGDRAAPLDHRDRGRFRDGGFGAVRVVAGAGSGRGGAHRSDGRSRARLQRPDREPPLHRGGCDPGPAGGGVLPGAAGGSDPRRGISGAGLPDRRHRDDLATGVAPGARHLRPVACGTVRDHRPHRGPRPRRIARPHLGDRHRDGRRHRVDRRHGGHGRQLPGDGGRLDRAPVAGGLLREPGRTRLVVHHERGGWRRGLRRCPG